MDDLQSIRKDGQFLNRASFRPDSFQRSAGLDVNESINAVIRKLAETYSQGAIAQILNEKGLLRKGGLLWEQFHISRWMKTHNVKAVHEWKGNRNTAHECEGI
jgi:hypothetical protein